MALILASSSSIRRSMLEQAAVAFEAVPANLDEKAFKEKRADPWGIAQRLAEAKALAVSSEHHGEWVIGSDSVVSVGERMFDKPNDRNEAAAHLRFFSGKEVVLTSCVALARNGGVDWACVDSARLSVRQLSSSFIERYLDREWPEVSYCVGVFRLEGRGVQLFEEIHGSYHTILGMPLLPLLKALRVRGLVES